MSMSVRREGNLVWVTLEGELGIVHAAPIHEQLSALLDGNTELMLDTNGLRRLDGCVTQLFYFLSLRVRSLRVEPSSGPWSEAWTTLGLDRVGDGST